MTVVSRKTFVRSCLSLAASACGAGLCPAPAACSRQSTLRTPRPGNRAGMAAAQAAVDPAFKPSYAALAARGELKARGDMLWETMRECRLCPRECGARRLDGKRGFCGASSRLVVAAWHPHFGEERPLVGRGGSGTVFFTHCSLRCVFCINWEISQGGQGDPQSVDSLADMMLHLQARLCHNINIVTPTHYSPHLLLALDRAVARGLRLPLVYNTHGWERLEILKLLEGVVDIYMPDFKYAEGKVASEYSSGAATYPEITKAALIEMHRQVGVARPGSDGLLYRGLLIRHLVMPNRVAGTRQVFEWIAANLPRDTYVNVMSQYRPMHKAHDYPAIARPLTREEFSEAVAWARAAGLTNLDIQG